MTRFKYSIIIKFSKSIEVLSKTFSLNPIIKGVRLLLSVGQFGEYYSVRAA